MTMTATNTTLRGRLLHDEPMSRHTSWRIGGPARNYYQPADLQDLCEFIKTLPADEQIYWVGLGSNLLVRDGGINGTVIALSGMLNELSITDDNHVRAEAGVASAKVARFSANNHLTGAEFLAGIPGTIGGALAMNAGAFGGVTWDVVDKVETLNRSGEVNTRTPDDYEIGYRHVSGPGDEWFVAAYFKLQPGELDDSKAEIKSLLARRGESQPTQLPNAGSVFKNPEGDYSARLIEACGLKGKCIGKACVSDKHANFIINTGEARADDVEALIRLIQQTVKEMRGIELQPEVRIIGEVADG
jgi:UDP-N-acetylmuramate dehydrogenase